MAASLGDLTAEHRDRQPCALRPAPAVRHETLRVLADYLRGDDALFSAATFIETTLQWLARPYLV